MSWKGGRILKSDFLTRARMERISAGGVPARVLIKLERLVGQTYPRRRAFNKAVREVLKPEEARAYLPTIVRNAH